MANGLLEWTVRTFMLVLAGLVTLSILGSIAAMSGQEAPAGRLLDPGAWTEPERTQPPEAAQDEAVRAPESNVIGGSAIGTERVAPPEPPKRWLEAITYALLALVGLGVLALILLGQAVRQMRRLANAAEARPREL
ncbi:MAG TPA: hypothetical protein VGB59_00210 [Allosphingosinicella sp.]